MGFSTTECAWSQTSIKMLGRTIIGIRGFEFEKTIDDEYIYGAGDEPLDITSGNKSYPGSIKLLKYELDLLNAAAVRAGYEDITEVPYAAIVITCNFKLTAGSPNKTITATGVKIGSYKISGEQNAKMFEVTLPFKSLKTVLV